MLRVWVFIQWVVEMWVFTGVGFCPVGDKDVGVFFLNGDGLVFLPCSCRLWVFILWVSDTGVGE